MAFASSRMGAQEAIIKPCDLCEDDEDVNWFCVDCIQNLCERCRKGHLKIVTCRTHRLVPILEGVVIQKTKISNMCQEHKEHFLFFCRTCAENICSICLYMIHKKHDFTDLRILHSELQSKLENIIKEKEDEQMNIAKNIEELGKNESQCIEELSEKCNTIDERLKAIHIAVDEEGDTLKESLKTTTDEQIKEVRQRKQKLEKRKNEYHETIQAVKRNLTLQKTSTLGPFVKSSTSKLQSLKPMAFSVTKGNRFNAGMTSHELIVDMIGKTESHMDIKESRETGKREGTDSFSELHIIKIHRLDVQNICHCICTCPDGSIWLGGLNEVYKMSSNFHMILHKIPNTIMDELGISKPFYSCEYIASLQSGDAIASYGFRGKVLFSKDSIVKLITSNGKGVDLTTPSGSACDIAVTNHDEVVVLVENHGWLFLTSSLVVYSKEGKQLNIIPSDYVHSGICINNDGNYVVSYSNSTHLTTLDYKGARLKTIRISTFGLRRMTCDRFGNILGISYDNKIHLISDDWEVERSFTVECENYINDICIDHNNHLLILVDGRKVIVAEYLQRK